MYVKESPRKPVTTPGRRRSLINKYGGAVQLPLSLQIASPVSQRSRNITAQSNASAFEHLAVRHDRCDRQASPIGGHRQGRQPLVSPVTTVTARAHRQASTSSRWTFPMRANASSAHVSEPGLPDEALTLNVPHLRPDRHGISTYPHTPCLLTAAREYGNADKSHRRDR